MRGLRRVVAFASALAFLWAAPAAASCLPPRPAAENFAQADAVVHGRIAEVRGVTFVPAARSYLVRVARVYKGEVATSVVVWAGPTRQGATSVDYMAESGTEVVLYLKRVGTNEFETNACTGNHDGAPTADEVAVFGAGGAPSPGGASASPLADPVAIGALALLVVVMGLLFLRSRERIASLGAR